MNRKPFFGWVPISPNSVFGILFVYVFKMKRTKTRKVGNVANPFHCIEAAEALLTTNLQRNLMQKRGESLSSASVFCSSVSHEKTIYIPFSIESWWVDRDPYHPYDPWCMKSSLYNCMVLRYDAKKKQPNQPGTRGPWFHWCESSSFLSLGGCLGSPKKRKIFQSNQRPATVVSPLPGRCSSCTWWVLL